MNYSSEMFFGLVPTNNLRFTTFYRVTSSLARLSMVVLYLVGLQEVHAYFTVWKSKKFLSLRFYVKANLVEDFHLDNFVAQKIILESENHKNCKILSFFTV